MYFPPIPNPQANSYPQQPIQPMYAANPMYPMAQQPPQPPINPFMYPTKLQPYNDRQFLCKTFNFRVPFIQAFLSLTHQEKLKFFLICQSRRLTGELTDKQTYFKVLQKITMIVNPNYKKPQQPQYQQISQEELKKKIMEREFEQKCEWELRKLGMGEEMGGFSNSSPGSGKVGSLGTSTNHFNPQMMSNVRPSNQNSSMSGGLSMNFDEFGMLGAKQFGQKTNQQSLDFNVDNNKEDDEFVYQQEVTQPETVSQWAYSTGSTNNNNDFQSSLITNQTQQQQISTTPQTFNPQPQPFSPKQPQQQQQWQQAQQVPQQTYPTLSSNNQPPTLPSLTFQQPQQKVQSIWDLQINQQQLNQSKPDIKEIFGIKRNQQDDFGGFEEANVEMFGNNSLNNSNNNVSSFLKQNEFRYETVAEVSNDWLLGRNGGTSGNNFNRNTIDVPFVNQDLEKRDQVFDIMGVQSMIQTHNNYAQPQWSFDNIQQPNYQPPQQQLSTATIPFPTQSSSILSQPTPLPFDINQFDISSLILPSQTQSQPILLINNSDHHHKHQVQLKSMEIDWGFGVNGNSNMRVDDDFDVGGMESEELGSFTGGDNRRVDQEKKQEKQEEEDDEWDEGQEVVVEASETPSVQSKPTFEQLQTQQPISFDFNIPTTHLNQTPQQITYDFNFSTNSSHPNPQFPLPSFTQPTLSSINYDPFDTIEASPSPQITYTLTNDFSFMPQPNVVPEIVSLPKVEEPSPVVSHKEIKPIRKIMKPPSMKTIEIESSNFNHFGSDKKEEKQQQIQADLSQVIEPSPEQQLQTNFQSPKQQMNVSSVFSKKPNLTAVNSLNLSIVPSLNIAVASSTNLPPASITLCHIPNQMSASTYITSSNLQPKQKIISTYNKQMTYTPDSFRSSIKSMLTKGKTFFRAFSKKNSGEENASGLQKERAEHYSMVDMEYGKNNREFLGGSQKVSEVYSPKISSKGFGKNKGLDFSIDTHIMQENGRRDQFEQGNNDEMNDLEALNQNQSRFNATVFTKRQSVIKKQESNHFTGKNVVAQPLTSQNDIQQQRQERQKILLSLSKSFILKLPQPDILYLNQQLKKNKFFFNKQFYLKLKSTLQKLSLSQNLTHFFTTLSRTLPTLHTIPYSTSFTTQLTFLQHIIQKLDKIDQLNKKFTLAMEDDQEEELAEVVMKSKQLTFEVSEDGQVVKRVVGLVLEGRVRGDMKQQGEQEVDEETDKFYGLYYMMVKLVLQRQPRFIIQPVNHQTLHHLTSLYTTTPSSSLSSKSHFLYTSTILYLLHTQLNQLQYIHNISQTIFGYLIKQHATLISKINQIKQLSIKYAESPQGIFIKLMESMKMNEYLEGLGEMAMVAERLSQVVNRVGVRFDKEEFGYDRLAKTIAESKQLPTKYNLLKTTSPQANNQSSYLPYLALLLTTLTTNKSPQQISTQMRILLKQKPICKVCLAPRKQPGIQEGDFIENGVAVSWQSLGSKDSSIEWCHYTCYNMLKMAFQDLAEENVGVE